MLEKPLQPRVIDLGEEVADISVEYPVHLSLRDPNRQRIQRVMRAAPRPVGWPGAFQPRAPTDPGVTVSGYRALVILITRQLARRQSIASARTFAGIVERFPASTERLSSLPAAVCICCGSSVSSRR